MKATIITLALTILATLGNIPHLSAENNVYSNIITDTINHTQTITLYESESNYYLRTVSRIVRILDKNGKLLERTSYKWNSDQNKWIAFSKHEFTYADDNKTPESLSFFKWDKKTKSLTEYPTKWIYIFDSERQNFSLAQDIIIRTSKPANIINLKLERQE